MSGQPHRKTGAVVMAARDKQRRALELRAEGRTLADIADELGYADKASAHNAITRTLDRHESAAVDELRALEGARLDLLQKAVWPLAMAGDLAAVRECVRIIDRRARLLGLDAPTLVDLNATATTVDLEGAFGRLMDVVRSKYQPTQQLEE